MKIMKIRYFLYATAHSKRIGNLVLLMPIFYLSLCLLFSCNKSDKTKESTTDSSIKVFEKMPSSTTGIKFNNKLEETEENNVMVYDGFYVGGGSAVIDVNNDGLLDLLFVSNQGPEKLYLNKSNFKFEDISKSSGIEGGDEWTGGVTVADVNADGWDDIYICCLVYLDPERRRNKLYINNKDNTFTERAREYGIDDPGFSVQGSFFDYDLDGDLDLYVVNQPPNHNKTRDSLMALDKPNPIFTDRLYKNMGNNKFVDVTKEAGIENFAFGLSATIADYFNDGWPDIYVANDYEGADYLYINNGNGTFTNVINESMKHISNFSMGADASDINNDGWIDIFTADMTAEDHYRNKTNMAGMDIKKFWKIANSGNHYQYMFNSLQLNQGNGSFSEIGLMAGVSKTDWSWSAFFGDFNNDQFKDLYVTNGILRDIRNRDFHTYVTEAVKQKKSALEIISHAPSVPIKNYMFENEKRIHFKNVSDEWGLGDKSFSQGACYGDLDNDGDLDLVVNNMNQEAFVYRNTTVDKKRGNFLTIKLKGSDKNLKSFGARIIAAYASKIQMAELSNTKGFMSTSEPSIHFGLGDVTTVDSIFIRWPSGKYLRKDNIKANSIITVSESEATTVMKEQLFQVVPFILSSDVTEQHVANIKHKENNFDDFAREILIPYKQSTLGPALESGDLNGDGSDEFFLGGSMGSSASLYTSNASGKYSLKNGPWQNNTAADNTDVLFFDADGDKDLDIYVAQGGNEAAPNADSYQDHLYINDGRANFTDGTSKLPSLKFSKSVVRSADIDQDGDQDLFVGGRLVPGKFGLSERSAILINNAGKFVDKTNEILPIASREFECVTDACWADFDKDGKTDLIVVGEWAPIRFFHNESNKLTEIQVPSINKAVGWWNSISARDLNGDGAIDFVVGNVGMNTKFKATTERPFYLYASDFDKNGTWDTYLASKNSEGKLFPVRGKQCSSEQMPFISTKFTSYNDFANASVDQILEGKLDGATQKQATDFHSVILWNRGNNNFEAVQLPDEAQLFPIYTINYFDFNKDGIEDLFLAGNYYNREVETTRSDAGVGQIILNDGKENFMGLTNAVSGIKLNKDTRECRIVKCNKQSLLLSANNNDNMQAFLLK